MKEGIELWDRSRGWQTKSPTPGVGGEGGSEGLKSQKCKSFSRGVNKAFVDLHT